MSLHSQMHILFQGSLTFMTQASVSSRTGGRSMFYKHLLFSFRHDYSDSDMPGSSLTANENYCRKLDKSFPWCYTADPIKAWDFCDVEICTCKFHTPSYKQDKIEYPKKLCFMIHIDIMRVKPYQHCMLTVPNALCLWVGGKCVSKKFRNFLTIVVGACFNTAGMSTDLQHI